MVSEWLKDMNICSVYIKFALYFWSQLYKHTLGLHSAKALMPAGRPQLFTRYHSREYGFDELMAGWCAQLWLTLLAIFIFLGAVSGFIFVSSVYFWNFPGSQEKKRGRETMHEKKKRQWNIRIMHDYDESLCPIMKKNCSLWTGGHVLNTRHTQWTCDAHQTKFSHPCDAEAYPTHSFHLQQHQTAYYPISNGLSTQVMREATLSGSSLQSYIWQQCSVPQREEV